MGGFEHARFLKVFHGHGGDLSPSESAEEDRKTKSGSFHQDRGRDAYIKGMCV